MSKVRACAPCGCASSAASGALLVEVRVHGRVHRSSSSTSAALSKRMLGAATARYGGCGRQDWERSERRPHGRSSARFDTEALLLRRQRLEPGERRAHDADCSGDAGPVRSAARVARPTFSSRASGASVLSARSLRRSCYGKTTTSTERPRAGKCARERAPYEPERRRPHHRLAPQLRTASNLRSLTHCLSLSSLSQHAQALRLLHGFIAL